MEYQRTFFSSSEEARFASLLQGSGLAPLTFMAMTALMLCSYKDKGHSVNYVSPVSALLAVTLAAVMFVDDTDLILLQTVRKKRLRASQTKYNMASPTGLRQ